MAYNQLLILGTVFASIVILLLCAIFIRLHHGHDNGCCECPATGPTGHEGPTGATGAGNTGGVSNGHGVMFLSSSNVNISNTNLIGLGSIANVLNEPTASYVITNSFLLKNLYVSLVHAPGIGATRTFTVRVNGINTSLSAGISNLSTTGTNLVNTVAVAPGDLVSVQVINSGTSPVSSTCEVSFEYL